jgi:uncharacterized protein (DUF2147 family)
MPRLLLGVLFLAAPALLLASPVGLWKTIDDATSAERAVVRISEQDGKLIGEIIEVLDTEADPEAVCRLCTDDRKDAPIVGLAIIRDVPAAGNARGIWDGGEILDPNDGKVYRVRLSLADNGRRLEVRGYIGRPLFGRTQVWQRAD